MRWAVLAITFFLAALAAPPLSVKVYPRFSNAPATVRITIRIEPHKDNRWLELVADCPAGPYRSTAYELEGAEAPTMHQIEWRDMPSCEVNYEVRAVVTKSNGKTLLATSSFAAIGADYIGSPTP